MPAARSEEPVVRGQGRRRLLEAARELFAERGYARTSTREVAERAGVTEPMVYRHFGTKAALFEQAAVEPFRQFMIDYWAEWEARKPGENPPAVDEAHMFVAGLYDIFHAQRELLIAMMAVYEFDNTLAGQNNPLEQAGNQVLERLISVIVREGAERGYPGFDAPVTARLIVAMPFAMAVHQNWLDPDGELTRERILDEISALIIHGVEGRREDTKTETTARP